MSTKNTSPWILPPTRPSFAVELPQHLPPHWLSSTALARRVQEPCEPRQQGSIPLPTRYPCFRWRLEACLGICSLWGHLHWQNLEVATVGFYQLFQCNQFISCMLVAKMVFYTSWYHFLQFVIYVLVVNVCTSYAMKIVTSYICNENVIRVCFAPTMLFPSLITLAC